MKKYLLLFMLLLTLAGGSLISRQLLAGGWTSGGGELIGDAHNPWFITKKGDPSKVIRYCLEVDEVNFGIGIDTISTHIEHSLRFWREEFRSSETTPTADPVFFVARDYFVKVNCDEDPPLVFQFGVLHDQQLQEMKALGWQPLQHVALAVRTDYDRKSLSGRGFVYLSPEQGPLALRRQGIRAKHWSDRGQVSFSRVLKHEIGHVFGLQHSGSSHEIMSAEFSEYAVSEEFDAYKSSPNFYQFPKGVPLGVRCFIGPISEKLAMFLGIDRIQGCLGFRVYNDQIEMIHQESPLSNWLSLGKGNYKSFVTNIEHMVRIWLPAEQTVFAKDKIGDISVIYGADRVSRKIKAEYHTDGSLPDPSSRQLIIDLNHGGITLSGLHNNQFEFDILKP